MFVDQKRDFSIRGADRTGRRFAINLKGVTDADRTETLNPANSQLQAAISELSWGGDGLMSLRFLKESEVAEIRLKSFMGDQYPQWIEDTFRTLHERGTKSLIIDLRGNDGGRDSYGAMLVAYLTDKPFRYIDHIDIKTINPSFRDHSDWDRSFEKKLLEGTVTGSTGGFLATPELHPGLAEQAPGRYPFLGKVLVLIDGGTFSTAADFCAIVRHLRRATFIGEETGGAYYGNNSGIVPIVTLPHSGLRFSVPMFEYWNAVLGDDGARRGIRPDYPVPTQIEHLLLRRDDQLDVGLSLASE
jgi:C-terminal processing protease CtpA/Prc